MTLSRPHAERRIRWLAAVTMTCAAALPALVSGAEAKRPVPHHRSSVPPAPYYPPAPPPSPPQLRGMQYLYGSAEAAALTRESWRALADHVEAALRDRPRDGVVLAPDATLDQPRFLPCGDRPPAIVLDVDETSVLNLGVEYDDLVANRRVFDEDVWQRWEKDGVHAIAPTPGARDALTRLRARGVAVIFNTNRNAFNAAYTERMLNDAGLGPAKHGETLYLAGDDASGSFKDGRRRAIAARYCVLAMAGDQLGDFSDLFNTVPNGVAARRALVAAPGIADLWGNGWFVMPNPVYGSALQGGADDIFPKDKQWRDPGVLPQKETH